MRLTGMWTYNEVVFHALHGAGKELEFAWSELIGHAVEMLICRCYRMKVTTAMMMCFVDGRHCGFL